MRDVKAGDVRHPRRHRGIAPFSSPRCDLYSKREEFSTTDNILITDAIVFIPVGVTFISLSVGVFFSPTIYRFSSHFLYVFIHFNSISKESCACRSAIVSAQGPIYPDTHSQHRGASRSGNAKSDARRVASGGRPIDGSSDEWHPYRFTATTHPGGPLFTLCVRREYTNQVGHRLGFFWPCVCVHRHLQTNRPASAFLFWTHIALTAENCVYTANLLVSSFLIGVCAQTRARRMTCTCDLLRTVVRESPSNERIIQFHH